MSRKQNVMWNDLWAALALVLVLEGILPFLNPGRWREAMRKLGNCDDRTLRRVGAASMLAGVALLYIVRS